MLEKMDELWNSKQNKFVNIAKLAIKALVILLIFIMAVTSLSIYGDIFKSQREKANEVMPYPYTSINLSMLPQDNWIKQSQLGILPSFTNGKISEDFEEQFISAKDNLFVPFSQIKDKFKLREVFLPAEDMLEFYWNQQIVNVRLGSTIMIIGANVKVFSYAPVVYNGEIYLPAEMITYLEDYKGNTISWKVMNGRAFYNTMLSTNLPTQISRIYSMEGMLGIASVTGDKKSIFEVSKLGKIKSVENASGFAFIKGTLADGLGMIEKGKLSLIKTFPIDSKLTEDMESVFWTNDKAINFYDIKTESDFEIKKSQIVNEEIKNLFEEQKIMSAHNFGEIQYVDIETSTGSISSLTFEDGEKTVYLNSLESCDGNLFLAYKDGWKLYNRKTGKLLSTFNFQSKPQWINKSDFIYSKDNDLYIYDTQIKSSKIWNKKTNSISEGIEAEMPLFITSSFILTTIDDHTLAYSNGLNSVIKEISMPLSLNNKKLTVKESGDFLIINDTNCICILRTDTGEIYSVKWDKNTLGYIY